MGNIPQQRRVPSKQDMLVACATHPGELGTIVFVLGWGKVAGVTRT